MRSMRAFRVTTSGLIVLDTKAPQPHREEIQHYRIRVRAVAISHQELAWLNQGRTLIFGHAYSGTIDGGLPGCRFPIGTDIFGMTPIGSDGAAADWIYACEGDIAMMPNNMTYEQAATIPLAAFLTWHAIFAARLNPDEAFLIVGAETAVGEMAQQIARALGLQGWALYPTYAKEIRAGPDGMFETIESLPQCDVVFDCMSDQSKLESWTHTKEGGTLITMAPITAFTKDRWPQIHASEVPAEHLVHNISTIFDALQEPKLQPLNAETFDLEDPGVFTSLNNMSHSKQIVLRLELPKLVLASGKAPITLECVRQWQSQKAKSKNR